MYKVSLVPVKGAGLKGWCNPSGDRMTVQSHSSIMGEKLDFTRNTGPLRMALISPFHIAPYITSS